MSIEEALAEIREGRFLIVVDDPDRENEGDLIMAASLATPASINFMATYGRGLICVPLTEERAHVLDLEPMGNRNTSLMGTPFTVSVDAREGTTTGISAADRAKTVQVLVSPRTRAEELARPGHIFPLIARDGGVLVRSGHTEAAVDLARLAGLPPVGLLCEIMDTDGNMARLPRLQAVAVEHGLKIVTVADLIEYRRKNEKLVRRIVTTHMPNQFGNWKLHLYESKVDEDNHLALVMGEIEDGENVLVRVHSSCLTGDVFGSYRCDCGAQLDAAMQMICKEGRGVVLYMRQEGRGIGLANKIRAYQLQDEGLDTVEANLKLGFSADLRHYGIGAQILADLGIKSLRIMSNNPRKIIGLQGYGLRVVDRVPLLVKPTEDNARYLATKASKMGHLLDEEATVDEEDIDGSCECLGGI